MTVQIIRSRKKKLTNTVIFIHWQVRRFDEVQSVRLPGQEKEFKLSAIAVNEGNQDEKVLSQLEGGSTQTMLCLTLDLVAKLQF